MTVDDGDPVAVVVTARPDDRVLVGFAHARCEQARLARRHGDPAPDARPLTHTPATVRALLVEDLPVFVWEPVLGSSTGPGGAELADALVTAFTQRGFTSLSCLDARSLRPLTILPSWSARVTGGGAAVEISTRTGTVLYSGALGDLPAGWLTAVLKQRRLILLAAPFAERNRGVDPAAALAAAAARGRLVTGAIPLTRH